MLRCASYLVTATYVQVRLIPQDSRASPADLFTMPSQMEHFLTFYDVVYHNYTSTVESDNKQHPRAIFFISFKPLKISFNDMPLRAGKLLIPVGVVFVIAVYNQLDTFLFVGDGIVARIFHYRKSNTAGKKEIKIKKSGGHRK